MSNFFQLFISNCLKHLFLGKYDKFLLRCRLQTPFSITVSLKEEDFKEKAKDIIIKLSFNKNIKINPYRLFDEKCTILNDSSFIIKLFKISDSQELIEPFIHILKKRGDNILEYSDLLIEIINIAIEQYDINNPSPVPSLPFVVIISLNSLSLTESGSPGP